MKHHWLQAIINPLPKIKYCVILQKLNIIRYTMPAKKAAFKDLRQNKKRAERNRKIKSDITALVRKVRLSVTKKDESKAKEWLRQAAKKMDKAVQKKILKKNAVARRKSRLAGLVNSLKK